MCRVCAVLGSRPILSRRGARKNIAARRERRYERRVTAIDVM